jgi:predicted nucleic acid-binding protein
VIPDATQRCLEAAIPVGERILLDTSCLAAYLDRTEDVHPLARHVLDAFVASGRNEAIISMVTMMEILVRPLRSSPPGHRTVLSFVRHHPNLEAVPLDLQMAQEAASLRASHRLRPPDALVAGTAIACGVGHLVTNDHDWALKLAPIGDRLGVVTLSRFLASD